MIGNEMLQSTIIPSSLETNPINEEEFFEHNLFQDVLEMKSLKLVSEATAIDLGKLQDDTYQSLFKFFQSARGINIDKQLEKDEFFSVFELYFKNYYLYLRNAIEKLSTTNSPIKIAYLLGKHSDAMTEMLEQVVKEIEKELI